jgi:hypothetical protein
LVDPEWYSDPHGPKKKKKLSPGFSGGAVEACAAASSKRCRGLHGRDTFRLPFGESGTPVFRKFATRFFDRLGGSISAIPTILEYKCYTIISAIPSWSISALPFNHTDLKIKSPVVLEPGSSGEEERERMRRTRRDSPRKTSPPLTTCKYTIYTFKTSG